LLLRYKSLYAQPTQVSTISIYNFVGTSVREPRSFPEVETWQSMIVVPMEITVNAMSEIDWNLKLPETVALLADDCIEFTFVSPYEDAHSY
jgi:hypothetical protein